MGSIVEITYNGEVYSFNFSTYVVSVGMENLHVPDLYKAIRLVEETDVGIAHPKIVKGEGLAILDDDGDNTIKTSLTVTLYHGWLVMSTKTSGVFKIKDGNLVADPSGPIFGENPYVTYVGYFSESGTISRVLTGSGVTEQDKIDIMNKVWEYERT